MLYFYPTTYDALETIKTEGIAGPVKLYRRIDKALAKTEEAVLVVNALQAGNLLKKKKKKVKLSAVPPEAILNLDPYLHPEKVVAGGGYVTRKVSKEIEVLMIFRRGAWDIPKGKLDEGESITECALREVREEVGIVDLTAVADLGVTIHGYPGKSSFKVKETFWYAMVTPENDFTPQADEGIEKVEWMTWSKAEAIVGYEIFRQHMKKVEKKIFQLYTDIEVV